MVALHIAECLKTWEERLKGLEQERIAVIAKHRTTRDQRGSASHEMGLYRR
jgi:hypothetical protein